MQQIFVFCRKILAKRAFKKKALPNPVGLNGCLHKNLFANGCIGRSFMKNIQVVKGCVINS